MKKSDEKQTKPSCPDVRNEHGAIVIARFWEIVKVAFWTALEHVKGSREGPTPRLEHFAFMAAGAFEVKNAVPL